MQVVPASAQTLCKAGPSRPYSHKKCKNPTDSLEAMRKLSSLENRQLTPESISAGQLEKDIQIELAILEKEYGKQCVFLISFQNGQWSAYIVGNSRPQYLFLLHGLPQCLISIFGSGGKAISWL